MKDREDLDVDEIDDLIELEPSFERPVETDPTEAVEEGEPYFPPTDPVVRVDDHGVTQVAGGFGDGDVRDEPVSAVIDSAPSDEGLKDAIGRGLRLDASTAHLHLHVDVLRGMARLTGAVQDEADADNAMEVASRVPGVVEVVDEMERVA